MSATSCSCSLKPSTRSLPMTVHISRLRYRRFLPRRAGWAFIARMADRFLAAVERSQRRRAFAALSDHLLRDIGMARDDVAKPTIANRPRSDAGEKHV